MSDEKVLVNWTLEQLNEVLVLLDDVDPLTTSNDRKLTLVRETLWRVINDINQRVHGEVTHQGNVFFDRLAESCGDNAASQIWTDEIVGRDI